MPSGRRKLLLADDSQAVQKVVRMFFGEEGYDVVAVGGGVDALRELDAEQPPDVLLADAVMPGPDGYELCERVKRDARLRHVPVVLLVGTFEPFNEAEARRVGADTVLTKPFQSIRDLVSKVGSLLGGEPKHDEHAPQGGMLGLDERADDSSPRADAPARRAEDASHESRGAHAGPRVEDASREHDAAGGAREFGDDASRAFGEAEPSPFADLGDDDELIEAKPADSFVFGSEDSDFAADVRGQHSHDVPTRADDFAPQHDSREEFSRFGAREFEPARANGRAHSAPSQLVTNEHAEENSMPAQPSFESRAAGAAAADDTLLDLGQMEPGSAAAGAAAEADDFILDLDDDSPLASVDFDDAVIDDARDTHAEPAHADAPSAFAEAAHGEQPATFSESAVPFAESDASHAAVASDASASDASRDEQLFTFGAADTRAATPEHSAHAEAGGAGETAHEFVMQDGPQGFASYASPQAVASAPRGFVEPEVVPADVPVPAVVEGEFTDGSVEGDLPKAPAAVESAGESAPRAASSSHAEPSTAGHAVVEGHTRVEEPLRADKLSQEAIDAIARRVVEMMSDKVVREIAWDVVPELAELLIKQKLEEGQK